MRTHALRFFTLSLLSYAWLYYGYKFHDPTLVGGGDFALYAPMYLSPLDVSAAPHPFVTRQLHAVVTHAIYALAPTYDTLTAVPEGTRELLLAALLSNYLGLLVAATGACASFERLTRDAPEARASTLPLLVGCACMLAFSAPVSVLTGGAEGWSWALMSLGFLSYVSGRTGATFAILAACVFQREVALLALAALAAPDALLRARPQEVRRHARRVLLGAACAACAYVALRLGVGQAAYGHQLSPGAYLTRWLEPSGWLDASFVFQALLSQNTLALYLLALGARLHRAPPRGVREVLTERFGLAHLGGAWLLVFAVCVGAGIGNNTGRVTAMFTPVWASAAGLQLWHVYRAGRASSGRSDA
jgi:hypothetical protein